MPEIKYSDNPNEETAFVETDDGQRNRAVLTVAVDGEIEFPANPNSTKVSVSVDGVKRKAIAVATIAGSGGGDAHNKGYFATLAELQEAYPTGEAGDWAIVAESDTVYIWDDTQQAWVDTDQKGQVTSVNNQTGAVVLGAQDVSAVPQYSTMPQASEDELGNIYQFTGTTDANYTNGYFYKCVSDGGNPATYSWSQVSVQPAPSGLPDQTGQSGKFLTTDGTDASWSDKPLVNNTTQTNSLAILGTTTKTKDVVIGVGAVGGDFGRGPNVVVGQGAKASVGGIAIGSNANAGSMSGSGYGSIAIGSSSSAKGTHSIQLGSGDFPVTNNDANTFKVANTNGNFEIMSADGTIPEARLADTTNAAQGQVLTLDSNLNAVWQAGGGGSSYTAGTGIDITSGVISVTAPTLQNTADSPDTKKSISISGTPATQWSSINIGYASSAGNQSTAVGYAASANNDGTAYGYDCFANGGVVVGKNAYAGFNVIVVGKMGSHQDFSSLSNCAFFGYIPQSQPHIDSPNSLGKGMYWGTGIWDSANNTYLTYKIIDAQTGTIPEARLADTTNAQQGDVLTLDSTGNAVWQAGGGGGGSSYTAGTGIDITNNVISTTSDVLKNLSTVSSSLNIGSTTSTDRGMATSVGINAVCDNNGVAIGYGSRTTSIFGGIAIGVNASSEAEGAIQLGVGYNTVSNTLKVGLGNNNVELLSANGTIPAARHASLPATDGTYVLKLVIASGVPTLSWVAE